MVSPVEPGRERRDSHQAQSYDSSTKSISTPSAPLNPVTTTLEKSSSKDTHKESAPLPDSLRRSTKGNISLACKNTNHEPTTLDDYLDDSANDATSFYNLYNDEEKKIVKSALHRVDGIMSWYLMLQTKCQKVGVGWAARSLIGPVVLGKAVWVGLRGIVDVGRDEDAAAMQGALKEAGMQSKEDDL